MVSYEATRRKYRGKTASGYEAKRKPQRRWAEENRLVDEMTADLPRRSRLLDAPVGTGRFLPLWELRGFRWLGVDASEEMLALARRKRASARNELVEGDVTALDLESGALDCAVCVRFLDLVDQDTMRRAVRELHRVLRAGGRFVLTIRLGPEYLPKSNTATHDERAFLTFIKRLGFRVDRDEPVFNAGWHVMQLEKLR
jgi:ubiquinone/menaquinone biosynthesis C-methylase UbiE